MGQLNQRSNSIILDEIATPTAEANKGKIYAKSDNRVYFQDGAGAENIISQADTNYAELYFDTNAVATTIETANTPIMILTTTTGLLNGWTYHSGSTGAITAYADYSGTVAGTIKATCATHGLLTNDIISIRGTSNYNSIFIITKINDNEFHFTDTWVDDDGASDFEQGSYLKAGASAAGTYAFEYSLSIIVDAADTLTSQISKTGTLCNKCIGGRKYTNNDIGNLTSSGLVEITENSRISLVIQSTGTTELVIQNGNLNLHRL